MGGGDGELKGRERLELETQSVGAREGERRSKIRREKEKGTEVRGRSREIR
jgi:hypothetical protein